MYNLSYLIKCYFHAQTKIHNCSFGHFIFFLSFKYNNKQNATLYKYIILLLLLLIVEMYISYLYTIPRVELLSVFITFLVNFSLVFNTILNVRSIWCVVYMSVYCVNVFVNIIYINFIFLFIFTLLKNTKLSMGFFFYYFIFL